MIEFVIYLFTGFLSTFGFVYLYSKLTGGKNINVLNVIVFILGAISVTLIEYYKIQVLNYLFFFAYFPLMFTLIKKLRFKKFIFYLFIVWLYGILIDLLLILIIAVVSFIISVNIYKIYTDAISVILSLFICLIFILLCRFTRIKYFTNNLYIKIVNVKYFDLLLILFSCFVLVVTVTVLLNITDLTEALLLSVDVGLSLLIFGLLIKLKLDDLENAKYLATLKENNEFYIKMEDENRIFRHNLNAKLLSIKSVSNKKARILIDDMLLRSKKNVKFSNKIKAIPYGLNGIIYQKLYPYLEDLNIKIDNNINYDIFKVLKPRRYNVIVEKMIIALDNAIEASLKSKKKTLVLSLYDENDYIVIEISNTFSSDLNVEELGKKNYSTKGNKRGLGLFSALRDNEAILSVKIINDLFVSKITARKKETS